jgi:hypothetical protein
MPLSRQYKNSGQTRKDPSPIDFSILEFHPYTYLSFNVNPNYTFLH